MGQTYHDDKALSKTRNLGNIIFVFQQQHSGDHPDRELFQQNKCDELFHHLIFFLSIDLRLFSLWLSGLSLHTAQIFPFLSILSCERQQRKNSNHSDLFLSSPFSVVKGSRQ
jgi:hypothetical protein